MIKYALYYVIGAVICAYFEFSEASVLSMMICANIYACGHAIIKELKK